MLRTGKPGEAAKIFLDIINRWLTYGDASRNLSIVLNNIGKNLATNHHETNKIKKRRKLT